MGPAMASPLNSRTGFRCHLVSAGFHGCGPAAVPHTRWAAGPTPSSVYQRALGCALRLVCGPQAGFRNPPAPYVSLDCRRSRGDTMAVAVIVHADAHTALNFRACSSPSEASSLWPLMVRDRSAVPTAAHTRLTLAILYLEHCGYRRWSSAPLPSGNDGKIWIASANLCAAVQLQYPPFSEE